MVPMVLKRTSYYLWGQDNWNEVQLGHVMPLALVSVSHNAYGIINGTILFLLSIWLKWSAAWFLVMCWIWCLHKQHVMQMALSIESLHLLGQDNWNEMQCDFSGHVMPLALMLASHDDHQYCQTNHYISYIKTIKMRRNMTFLIMWHNCHWHWHIMMPLVLVSLSVLHDFCSIINGTITF